MAQIVSTLGARFYNMPDKDIWFEKMEIVLTKAQRPSVTTILEVWPKGKEFWDWLASRMSYEEAIFERDMGGERGTRCHDTYENLAYGDTYSFEAYAEMYFRGQPEIAVPEWRKIEAFEQWHTDWGSPGVVTRRNGVPAIECALYSWEHGYAGTTDKVYTGGKFGSKRIMVDYKTSKGIWDSFWAQLAAYFVAWHEMGEEPIDGIAIFRPNAKKACGYDFEVIEDPKQIEEWFQDFLAAYRLWRRHRKRQKLPLDARTVFEVRDTVHIGKLAQRPAKKQAAWEPPKQYQQSGVNMETGEITRIKDATPQEREAMRKRVEIETSKFTGGINEYSAPQGADAPKKPKPKIHLA